MLPHERALKNPIRFNAKCTGNTVLVFMCMGSVVRRPESGLFAAGSYMDLLSHSDFKLVKKYPKTIAGVKVFIKFAIRMSGYLQFKTYFI